MTKIYYKELNKFVEFKYLYVKIKDSFECIFQAFQPDKGKKYKTIVYTESQDVKPPKGTKSMDIFCVAGGQGGSAGNYVYNRNREISGYGGGGGNGGSTNTTRRIFLTDKQVLKIRVGGGGGGSWGYNGRGGAGWGGESYVQIGDNKIASSNNDCIYKGSAGGFGGRRSHWSGGIVDTGNGASDGGNSTRRNWSGGGGSVARWETNYGQGVTTRAFEESEETLFAGGGGGGSSGGYGGTAAGAGGEGGGGQGGLNDTYSHYGYGSSGTFGTGGGGGGGVAAFMDDGYGTYQCAGGNGGSGVVIIRFYGTTKR